MLVRGQAWEEGTSASLLQWQTLQINTRTLPFSFPSLACFYFSCHLVVTSPLQPRSLLHLPFLRDPVDRFTFRKTSISFQKEEVAWFTSSGFSSYSALAGGCLKLEIKLILAF